MTDFKKTEDYQRYVAGMPGEGAQIGKVVRLEGLPMWEKNDVSNRRTIQDRSRTDSRFSKVNLSSHLGRFFVGWKCRTAQCALS